MRLVIAPDKFRGSLSSAQAAAAIARGLARARPDAVLDCTPMADGGEGTLDILLAAHHGNRRRVWAHGPLGKPIEVPVGLVHHASTAVVEMAQVSGLSLLPGGRGDPLQATTYGLGEVLRAVIDADVEEILLTVGGSATVDGGAGMMQALGLALVDAAGRPIKEPICGGRLADIARFAWDHPPENLHNVRFTVGCDVLNPACGVNGAARVYGPQKGADEAAVERLEAGMSRWAGLLEAQCGRVLRDEPGTGAAGGVALPLVALLEASLTPAVDLVSEAVGLSNRMVQADGVVTGEGRLDRQSLMGKVVGAVGRMARSGGVPCVAIVGATGEGVEACRTVLNDWRTLDGPIEQTEALLVTAAERLGRTWP